MILKKILLGISVFFLNCGSDNNPVDAIYDVSVYRVYVESVKKSVPAIRELNFTVPVKAGFMERSDLAKEFVTFPRRYANMTVMMKQLGFLPDSVQSIEPYVAENQSGFHAAYYITGTDSLVVIDPQEYPVSQFKEIVAHELTHALQDQNFNISQDDLFPNRHYSSFCTDFYLARRCVAEGDAMTSEFRYVISENSLSASPLDLFSTWRDEFFKTFGTREIPVYLNLVSMFPYEVGSYFVSKIWSTKGWEGVNQLYYSNRPLSTAEIITGEKFEPHRFDYSSLIKNWYDSCQSVQIADDDNYGPVMLLALLKDYTDATHAEAALGWQGDRVLYLLADNAQWGKFVWSFQFKDASSAKYCMQGIDAVLSARTLGNVAPQRLQVVADSLITYTTGAVATTLLRDGEALFWIENVSDPTNVASGIQNASLAKRSGASYLQIESDPEIVEMKKRMIKRKELGERLQFSQCCQSGGDI